MRETVTYGDGGADRFRGAFSLLPIALRPNAISVPRTAAPRTVHTEEPNPRSNARPINNADIKAAVKGFVTGEGFIVVIVAKAFLGVAYTA